MTSEEKWLWCEHYGAQVQHSPPYGYTIMVAGYNFCEALTFEEAAQAMEAQMRAKLEVKSVNGSVMGQVEQAEQLMLMEGRV